jgi:hypothetical protein
MAWIDVAYVNDAIGSEQVVALGLAAALTPTTPTTRFVQYEIASRSVVCSAMQFAGYAVPAATLIEITDSEQVTAAYLKKMVAAILLRDAFALIPGIDLTSAAQQAIGMGLEMLNGLVTTDVNLKIPIPNMQPNTLDGIGGVKFNAGGPLPPQTFPVFRMLRGTSF